jgi:hypothetical protein
MPDIVYERPYLYPKQAAAIFTDKRWSLCEASTKSGKTVASIARILEWGFAGQPGWNYWWVAPVSDQARIAFTRVKQNLTAGSFTSRESPTPVVNLLNGVVLSFKSADNPDSLYGEDVHGVIIDEASRAKVEAWYAVRSTLTATGGPAVIIGNVKGRKNWFYEFARRVEAGQEPNGHFSRITWKDAVEAGVLDLEEIEDARRNLPERVFLELYEAEASDDAGNPFGFDHIKACVGDLSNLPAVAFGVDLAKKRDYVVVIGLDENGRTCSFSRWQGVPWPETIRRIHAIVGEDTPALVDSTGLGDPVLEELQIEHGNFTGYMFSASAKQRIMEGLAVSIQGHELTFPDGPIRQELDIFEYTYTPTGVRYSAPDGFHDDCVCSLALAREQFTRTAPGQNITKYIIEESIRSQEKTLGEEFADNLLNTDNADLMSWRNKPAAYDLDNELTSLYEKTLREHPVLSNQSRCFHCHKPIIGSTKVTDGFHFWHPECNRIGFR